MRIVNPGLKVLYIVVFLGVGQVIAALIRSATGYLAYSSLAFLDLVWVAAGVLVGIRVFRGDNEERVPPRPWWRWTARPRAGAWLTVYFFFGALLNLVNFVRSTAASPGRLGYFWAEVVMSVLTAALGVGYLNSTLRLRKRPDLVPPRMPKSSIAPPPPSDRVPENPFA